MILGAILAGGQARRFGSNKALARWNGATLIEHVAAALSQQVDALVVCGGDTAPNGIPLLQDCPEDGLGPLGGLAAALAHAEAHGFAGVVSAGCDTPVLPDGLVGRLRAAGGASCLATNPIIGWWPIDIAASLIRHVATDPHRSMRGWARAAGATEVTIPEFIANINTAEDLAELPTSAH